MPKYTVQLSRVDSITVVVTADDAHDAIDTACDAVPDICAQCAGWNAPWSIAVGDELEPEAVTDAAGADVWVSSERWTRSPDYSAAQVAVPAQVQPGSVT